MEQYQLKNIFFKGKLYKIVTQSEKGPSALIAIANTLILKDLLGLSTPNQTISNSALLSLVGAALRKTSAQLSKAFDASLIAHLARNIDESIARLPEFENKMHLTVGFHAIDDFEMCDVLVVFDTLGLKLVHAWLVDPAEPFAAIAQAEKLNSQTIERALPAGKAGDHLRANWLLHHPSRITPFGVTQLVNQLPADQFRIFYAAGGFHTLYKHQDHVYLLATEPHAAEVWTSLEPHGRGCFDGFFQPLSGTGPSTPPSKIPGPQASYPSPGFQSPDSSSPGGSLLAGGSVAGQSKKVIIIDNVMSKETKTLRLPRWPTTYDALRRFVQTLFKDLPPSFSVTYRDPDNDYISITTPAEFEEAIRLATETSTNELQIRVGPSLSSVVMSSLPPVESSPLPPTPVTPVTPVSKPQPQSAPQTPIAVPQPGSSSSTAPPSSPAKREASSLVPHWFAERVSAIFDGGHRYAPALIIESLIRNAGNVDETIAELQASKAKQIAGRRITNYRFSKEFTTSLEQIMAFIPFNPYACASALILKGGNIPEAVLELSTNLAEYENMLTPVERGEIDESPEQQSPVVSINNPASQPQPQPVLPPQPQPVLPSQPQPVLPPQPQPVLPPQPQPSFLPHLQPSPTDLTPSRNDDIQLLDEQARQKALQIEEAERKLQQEKAEYYRSLEQKRRLQTQQLQGKLDSLTTVLSHVTAELEAMKKEHIEATSNRDNVANQLNDTRQQIQQLEQQLLNLRNQENLLSAAHDKSISKVSEFAERCASLSAKVDSTNASRRQIESQIQSLLAPTANPAASIAPGASIALGSMPVSSSLASFSLPPSFLSNLNTLESQGFLDHQRNFELLLKNAGDLQATINALLQNQP